LRIDENSAGKMWKKRKKDAEINKKKKEKTEKTAEKK